MKPRTRAVHAGSAKPGPGRPEDASPPIRLSSAPLFDRLEDLEVAYEEESFIYRRFSTPNQAALEQAILELEGGGETHEAVVLGSGMAAITLACLALNPEGRRVVGAPGLYGGTFALLSRELPRLGVDAGIVDLDDDEALGGAGVVVVETISNPAMRVADIPALARRAHAAGAVLLVDNTFASPVICRPLELGADCVMESATKYLCGHADAMAGTLVLPRRPAARVRELARVHGSTAAPMDCWLILRGIRTLVLRVEAASAGAARVAAVLAEHPAVREVNYPGLGPDPVAARLLSGGFGGMLSFSLKGGEAAVMKAVAKLRLIALMPSLADVSTTISHPASTSHRGMDEAGMIGAGTSAGMIRLSVGIEDVDDILEDLHQALA